MLLMNINDARRILMDLMDKRIEDSLIYQYEQNENKFKDIIIIQKSQINELVAKSKNQNLQNNILLSIIDNKNIEISLLNNSIKAQKKQIRRQKNLKILGFSAAIVLPVAVVLLLK